MCFVGITPEQFFIVLSGLVWVLAPRAWGWQVHNRPLTGPTASLQRWRWQKRVWHVQSTCMYTQRKPSWKMCTLTLELTNTSLRAVFTELWLVSQIFWTFQGEHRLFYLPFDAALTLAIATPCHQWADKVLLIVEGWLVRTSERCLPANLPTASAIS